MFAKYSPLSKEDGHPVIFLHGCPSTFAEFRHFLPSLTFYGFKVIGFDQPGYGNSPGMAVYCLYSSLKNHFTEFFSQKAALTRFLSSLLNSLNLSEEF